MDCVEWELEGDRLRWDFLLGANELDLELEYFPLLFPWWLSSHFGGDGELEPDGCRLLPYAMFLAQNPLACPITNSHLLSNVNAPKSILMDELLNLCNSFRSCAASGSPRMVIIVNWCATGHEPGMPLKHRRTTQALVSEGLLNHCEGLRSTFPKIGTKFDAHSLLLSLIHCENHHRSRTRLQINACGNCPRPPTYVQLGTLSH